MLFINILMLFGLAAVASPIIIHLLMRRTVRSIAWGAWLFLEKTLKKRKRKIILEDILLIACRCLALALLALAFARPFIRPDSPVPWGVTLPLLLLAILALGASFAVWRYPRWRKGLLIGGSTLLLLVIGSIVFERQLNLKRFGRDATKDVVLVIDCSGSMSIRNDGRSNLDRALEEARAYVRTAPANTSFSVIVGGPVPLVLNEVPVSDRRIVLNAIDSIERRYANGKLKGTMQIGGCLTAAGVVLQAGHNAVKQIVIVGDGQTAGWNLEDKGRWATINRMFSSLDVHPGIVWRTLPLPASVRNISVASVRPVRDVVGVDRETVFEMTLVNKGDEAVTPQNIVFEAGSRRQSKTETTPIQPGENRVYVFRHRFVESGAAIVTAKVDCEDDIPSDNECEYAMPVLGKLKVLIVSGDASSTVGKGGSAAYLNLALRPELVRAAASGASAATRDYLVETKIEDLPAFAERRVFNEFAAVIVSGVRWLPEPSLEALGRFVRGGGGLWFLPGTATDAKAFADWKVDGERLLPAPLGTWRQNESPLDPGRFEGMLSRLRVGTDLGSATPQMVMAFGDGWERETETVARLADDTPLVLARRFGGGLVVETAVPFDELSGLVSKHAFLPMVHEIAYALARPVAVALDVRPSDGLTLFVGKTTSENGLLARYYPSLDRKTSTPIVRITEQINANWGLDSPFPGTDFPADNFSIVWRGVLQPPLTGEYKFVFDVDDRLSVRIGNREVRNWGTMRLDSSKTYSFVAVYEEDLRDARVQLRWIRPGEKGAQTVPSSVFRAELAGSEGAGELVTVTDPHGETFTGEIYQSGEGLYLHLTQSIVPGRYSVADIPETLVPWLGAAISADGRLPFTVSADANESRMVPVTAEQIAALNRYIRILQALKQQDVIDEIAGRGFGKEIWRLLASIALLLLVIEPAISRWIAANRRTGDIIDTEGSWIRT